MSRPCPVYMPSLGGNSATSDRWAYACFPVRHVMTPHVLAAFPPSKKKQMPGVLGSQDRKEPLAAVRGNAKVVAAKQQAWSIDS
jgi:hypothetical protein